MTLSIVSPLCLISFLNTWFDENFKAWKKSQTHVKEQYQCVFFTRIKCTLYNGVTQKSDVKYTYMFLGKPYSFMHFHVNWVVTCRAGKCSSVNHDLHFDKKVLIVLFVCLQATSLYCCVLEYCAGGELLAFIKSSKDCRLGESAARPFIRQLISALHYLHERGVVHR